MINFGNKTGHFPRWTPYAQAIAEHYAIQIPFFLTVKTGLTTSDQIKIELTDPYEHDTLIFGAHINIGSAATPSDFGQQTFLNVSENLSGLRWVSPGSVIDAAPATAFGGVQTQKMSILQLPEAFFLPANTELRHEWRTLTVATDGGNLTWVGVQLIRPKGGKAPEYVTMPDGCAIKVGSRLPWFACLGLGTQATGASSLPSFTLIDQAEYQMFTPAAGCDVEVHDINANYFTQGGVSSDPDNVRVQIYEDGQRRMFKPTRAPATALMGSYTEIYPGLPFTKPYLLKKGNRLLVNMMNLTGADILEPYAVLRGVQLCEY